MLRRAAPFVALALILIPAGVGLAQVNQRARDLRSAADTRRQIEALRGQLARVGQARGTAGQAVDQKRARLEALNAREAALVGELGRDRHRLARLLSALQLFRRNPPPALLVSPRDARDAVRAAILIRAMTPELQRRAATYAAQARSIGVLRRQAAAASEDLFTAESVVADRKGELERMILEKTQLERAYAQDALTLNSESRTLGTLTDGLAAAAATGPLVLTRPAPGPIVRRFGQALPAGGRAEGLSIRAANGQTVTSPAAGTVDYVGALSGWGVVLVLRSQGAYHLVIAGLDQVSVSPGQTVAAGAPIGRMSDRAQSDQDLYLEVRERGAPADPERWLKQGSR
ncbi:MAG: peptidase [Caulobacter sp.]|nr:peptidase [Caulobacter sp.]